MNGTVSTKLGRVWGVTVRGIGWLMALAGGLGLARGLYLLVIPAYRSYWEIGGWPFIMFGAIVLVMGGLLIAGVLRRLFLFNFLVLALFCGLWCGGFYISERWIQIIDWGLPWSWLAPLFAISYAVSFFSLRKGSKPTLKSFAGPLLTVPALVLWTKMCAIWRDPFY